MGIFDKLFKKKAIESQQSIPVKQDKQEKTTVNMVTQKAEPTVKEQLIRGYVGTYKKQVDYATVKELNDYSGSPAHPGRSSAQPDRASAHLIRSAVQLMPVADQHTC